MANNSSPSLSFCGVQIFAERDGDRVTGRVVFPYESNGRTQCPIDYQSRRPVADPDREGVSDPYRDRQGAALDERGAERLRLVRQWQRICTRHPKTNKQTIAKDMLADYSGPLSRVSFRTLQSWARKLDIEGPEGLCDRYVPAPKKVLTLNQKQAQFAVTVCAWWAFRIGNCECIDTKMMHMAVTQLIEPGYDVADLLATIDCCYSYSCDRTKYPFKPFRRWAKHDFPVPWLYRACDENDYRRGLAAARNGQVPLQSPRTTMSSSIANAQMRKREALRGPTRRAIHDLAPASATPPRSPSEPALNTLQTAGMLKSMGLPGAATRVVQAAAPGIPALAANEHPQTIAEALGTLDDGYRGMLDRAAHGDRQAGDQAIATMPLWWDSMPQSIRNNIDFQVDAWQRDHPNVTNGEAAGRKLAMLLPKLRSEHTGAQRLAPAARIPAAARRDLRGK